MFLFRLKQEFAENLRLLVIYWLCLALVLWSHFTWWFGSSDPYSHSGVHEAIGGFSALGLCGVTLMIVGTLFKRDDLKCPQDFCATRPIRSLPLYGAKLAFTWLMLALPVGVAMTVTGFVAGHGIESIWNGLEMMAWFGFISSLLALSCMAYPGGGRSFITALAFGAGLMITAILINLQALKPLFEPLFASNEAIKGNLLVTLATATVAAVWMCHRQYRNKHSQSQLWWFAMAGIACVLFVSFTPITYTAKGVVTVLPKATAATLVEYDLRNGDEGGTGFVSGGISVTTELVSYQDSMILHGSQALNTVGFNEPWFKIEYGGIAIDHSEVDERKAILRLSYKVYEDTPDPNQGWSSTGGSQELAETIAKLPKRSIRIVDTVILHRQTYQEIHHSPLSKPFALHHKNLKIDYHPDTSDIGSDYIISWKSYIPSLASSTKRSLYEQCRFNIKHPDIDEVMSVDDFGGGGGGTGSIFGRSMSMSYDFGSDGIRSNYFWHNLDKDAQQRIQDEWEDKALLVVEVAGHMERLEVPIDVKVEIPDPEALRELLKEGKL